MLRELFSFGGTARRLSRILPATRSVSSSSNKITIKRTSTPLPPNSNEGELYPVAEGEVLGGRYEALRYLGRGLYSTVWLVRDIRTEETAAMKVMASSLTHNTCGPDELGIMSTLLDGHPQSSTGKKHIPQLLHSFVHQVPNGGHLCLVLEPLGLSVFDVYMSFPLSLPLIVVQRIAKHVLLGLQYIHDCGVIHTDIKADNIMMTGAGFPEGQSTMELDIADLFRTTYKLTDFGSANTLSRQWAAVIQPLALRAPEIIIGAPWNTQVDIWNFGCLMYELARGAALFDPAWQNAETGMDHAQTHLAQMVGLLGEFPKAFIAQGERSSTYFNEDGKLLVGGPYSITLLELMSRGGHPPNELEAAVDFLGRALTIDPRERWSAAQLLTHPWMQNIIDFA